MFYAIPTGRVIFTAKGDYEVGKSVDIFLIAADLTSSHTP